MPHLTEIASDLPEMIGRQRGFNSIDYMV